MFKVKLPIELAVTKIAITFTGNGNIAPKKIQINKHSNANSLSNNIFVLPTLSSLDAPPLGL